MSPDGPTFGSNRDLRHAYGWVLASLLRRYGQARLDVIEDALSQALLEALPAWRHRGAPADVRAWLYRAASHRLIDSLRRDRRHTELNEESLFSAEAAEAKFTAELPDDELHALFVCAHPAIPVASQLIVALRTLGGFSSKELSARLLCSEESVQKRYERAKEMLRALPSFDPAGQHLALADLNERQDAVLAMLYVMFTEGYFSSHHAALLRLEICVEAMRLAECLAAFAPRLKANPANQMNRDFAARLCALRALMHLHHARRQARTDASGEPVLLPDQDRRLYQREELAFGMELLAEAGELGKRSRFHVEAEIAGEHAFAPSFSETRWSRIVALYDELAALDASPLHELHACIALSYAVSPQAALDRLTQMSPPTWLLGSHLWLATRADFQARLGHYVAALELVDKAIALAPVAEQRVLLRHRATWMRKVEIASSGG